MKKHGLLLTTASLALLSFSVLMTPPAHAGMWIGNDDGEFDRCTNCNPTYVELHELFSGTMTWNPYQSHRNYAETTISLQYNPDGTTSFWNQVHSDWFQTVITTDSVTGCPAFSIQVWNSWWNGWDGRTPVFRTDYYNLPCQASYVSPGAEWNIRENLVSTSNEKIKSVYFWIQGPDGVRHDWTYGNSNLQTWWWLRPNLCWCGVDGGTVSFTNGYGTSYATSDINMVAIDPPNCLGSLYCISTAENSNMPYSAFQNSPNTNLYQTFGWPPYGGGGGGGGGASVAPGTLITMSDDSEREVQTLKAGDRIIMYDVYSGASIHATITKMLSFARDNKVTIYVQGNNPPLRVDTKPDFYVWTSSGPVLKPVTTLQPGDLLYSYYQHDWMPVTKVTINYGGSHTYYDLITDPQFNSNGQALSFIANGIADPCIPSCPL